MKLLVTALIVLAVLMLATAAVISAGDAKSKDTKGKPTAVASKKIADLDPVCKMKVNKNEKPKGGQSTYKGITYYFCNTKCKAEFDKNPAKYVQKPKESPCCGM